MQYVKIVHGTYRNDPVLNMTFPLVKAYQESPKGGFVTVNAKGILPGRDVIRVKVAKNGFSYVNSAGDNSGVHYAPSTGSVAEIEVDEPQVVNETDDEVIARIGKRFDILHEMTRATVNGDVRAMIVVGPPGVGKSFGVELELSQSTMFSRLANKTVYEVVNGSMTALGLYTKLYEYKEEGNVLVFDDCDSILLDDVALNLLKAALDSSKKRTIHWNSDSRLLRQESIPNSFEFKGSVIFITNIKFDHVRSNRLRDHLDALMSRCHYLDLTINTQRDKLLRIKQIAQTGTLFPAYGMSPTQEEEIVNFMFDNADSLREISLRMAIKLADLRRMSAKGWQELAKVTCLKGGM